MATTTKKRRPSKATGKGQAFSTLVTFDTHGDRPPVRFLHEGIPFDEVPRLTPHDYRPWGGTPLYDAVKETVAHIDRAFDEKPDGVHFAFILDESGSMAPNQQAVIDGFNEFVGALQGEQVQGDGRVMVVIFTDGLNNSSRNATQQEIQGLVKERENNGWVFSYMGANHDVWTGAGGLGIDTSKAGAVTSFSGSVRGTKAANKRLANYAALYTTSGESGLRASAMSLGSNVSDEEADDDAGQSVANYPTSVDTPKPQSTYNLSDALDKARGTTKE